MQGSDATEGPSPAKQKSPKIVKKLMKRAHAGSISSLRSYLDCREHGLKAASSITIKRDVTRAQSAHDLNASELRDLIRSLFSDDAPLSKLFDIQNKGFIRHCFVFNVVGDEDAGDSGLAGSGFSAPIRVRASRKASNVGAGEPATVLSRLLTSSPDPPPEFSCKDATAAKRPREDWSVAAVEPHVLSLEMMRNWGYPLPRGTTAQSADANGSDAPASKKLKQDDDSANATSTVAPSISVGRMCPLPSLEESKAFLGSMLKIDCGEIPNYKSAGRDQEVVYYEAIPSHGGAYDIIAVDCEMCDTAHGLELTRCSLLDGDGAVILDSLVKPYTPVTEYRSLYSGITPELLDPVTTRLEQIQAYFLSCVGPNTVVVGHSLESDLNALRIVHKKCADTAHLYPHSRGFPYRNKLKFLARQYLKWNIQQSDSSEGHDSEIDAKAALELVKLKVKHGPGFGISGSGITSRPSLLTTIHEDRCKHDIATPESGGLDEIKASLCWTQEEVSSVNMSHVAASSGIAADMRVHDSSEQVIKAAMDQLKIVTKQRRAEQVGRERKQFLCAADIGPVQDKSSLAHNLRLINDSVNQVFEAEKSTSLGEDIKASMSQESKESGTFGHLRVDSSVKSAEHALIIVVHQKPLGPVLDLLKLRRTCSGPKATKRWTSQQEEDLKGKNSDVNCGNVYIRLV